MHSFQKMNRSNLERDLDFLSDTLEFIDNFTRSQNLDAFNKNNLVPPDDTQLSINVTSFLKVFIISAIVISSLCGNILVLVALIVTPAIHQTSAVFFASLSLADLGVTVLGRSSQLVCLIRLKVNSGWTFSLCLSLCVMFSSDAAQRCDGVPWSVAAGRDNVPGSQLPGRLDVHRVHPPPAPDQLGQVRGHRGPASPLHSLRHPAPLPRPHLPVLVDRSPDWPPACADRPLHHRGPHDPRP